MNVAELEFWNNFCTALVWVEASEWLRLKDTIPLFHCHMKCKYWNCVWVEGERAFITIHAVPFVHHRFQLVTSSQIPYLLICILDWYLGKAFPLLTLSWNYTTRSYQSQLTHPTYFHTSMSAEMLKIFFLAACDKENIFTHPAGFFFPCSSLTSPAPEVCCVRTTECWDRKSVV